MRRRNFLDELCNFLDEVDTGVGRGASPAHTKAGELVATPITRCRLIVRAKSPLSCGRAPLVATDETPRPFRGVPSMPRRLGREACRPIISGMRRAVRALRQLQPSACRSRRPPSIAHIHVSRARRPFLRPGRTRGWCNVAYRAVPAAEDVGLDQIHRDDLLRFHSHRSFNGRVPPRAVADVAVPQPAGGGGLWRMEK